MVLNSEFWEALTGNQRRKFAKANCEATYKKAIIFQIFAAVLAMLGVGLFLPIGDKARRYFKGYYSLREEEMPVPVKILCVLDFVFGLFASIIIMLTNKEEDYGLFENTLSRPELEAMLNEADGFEPPVGVGDDPFRIANFSDSVVRPRESKPIRKGCEKFDAVWLVVINAVTVVLFAVILALIFSSCDGGKDDEASSVPSFDNSSSQVESVVSKPTAEQFGNEVVHPTEISDGERMKVTAKSGLRLRYDPSTTKTEIIKMPYGSEVTVYNKTDETDWYFVSYEKDGTEMFGWACVKQKDDIYLVPIEDEGGASSSEAPVVSESPLTDEEIKNAIVNHVKAVNYAVNDFVGYLTIDKDEDGNPKNTLSFGDGSNLSETYIKATNASSNDDLRKYLEKYMVTSLAASKANLTEVTDTTSIPSEVAVIYNGGIYLHYSASSSELDMGSLTVLSSSAAGCAVTVTTGDDQSGTVNKLTITFQYIDDKFLVSGYEINK